jgi:phosphoribosylformimino-5-aminoimidazole carboxamide ribonucleotide (ProFAR) isomerase
LKDASGGTKEELLPEHVRLHRAQHRFLQLTLGRPEFLQIHRLPCRVGGGIRSVERAREVLTSGAHAVIASSALFRDGAVDLSFARALADGLGAERVIAAVDSRGGQVVIHGWTTVLPITAVEAVGALEPYCAEFLYTHVDKEGLMQGTDMDAIMAVRRATARRVTAAGGITTWDEIDRLDAAGVDAVVGMAIYTGQLPLERSNRSNRSDRS